MSQRARITDYATCLAVFAAAFLSYLRTMRPTFGWLDTSELATGAWFLGIGHNPGYPTFMLLAHPFRWLPVGSAAFRMNLFSVACGAVAVLLAYLLAWRLCRNRPAAVAAALTLAFGRTLWDLTTEIEVYTLHACIMLGILLCLVGWRQQGGTHRLAGAGLLWGLGMGNHPLTLMLFPALVLLAAGERKGRLKRLGMVTGWAAVGLLVYAYVPIRAAADPPPAVNNPHTLSQFWQLLSAPGYRPQMFSLPWAVMLGRAGRFLFAPARELTRVGMAMGLVGAAALWRRDRLLLGTLAMVVALVAGYAAGYDIFDIYAYLLPTYLVWALLVAVGAAALSHRLGPLLERLAGQGASMLRGGGGAGLVAVALLCLPVWQWAGNLGPVDASQDYGAEDFARAAMQVAAPGALIVGDWYDIAPLGFAKYVLGVRRDLHLSAAFSAFASRTLQTAFDPDYLRRFPAVYAVEQQTDWSGHLRRRYLVVPEGPLLRVYVRGRPALARRMAPEAKPRWDFGGVAGLLRAEGTGRARAGRNIVLHLEWLRLGAIPRPLEAVLSLESAKGDLALTEKIPVAGGMMASEWRPGEAIAERLIVYLPSDLEPGRYCWRLLVRPRQGRALVERGTGAREIPLGWLRVTPRRDR